jgi:hypothetical protein
MRVFFKRLRQGEKMFKVADPSLFDSVPEFGMGYHFGIRVEIGKHRVNASDLFVVLNGTVAGIPDEFLRLPGNSPEAIHALDMPTVDIRPAEEVTSLEASGLVASEHLRRAKEKARVHGSPPFRMKLSTATGFVRFSAFANDRRIKPDGSVLAGTFVTSASDAAAVPNALAAVGRYALPNPNPPVFRFDIAAAAGTHVRYGTVIPQFGQAGGGAEMEFYQALTPASASGPINFLIF